MVEHLRPRYLVYHSYDAFHLTEQWSDETARWQRRLVERADLLIATAKVMVDEYPESERKRVRELPNGVDLELFTQAQPEPEELADIPHPRIGYMGAVNHKVDVHTIAETARAHPDWHWVLVGNVLSGPACGADWLRDWDACRELPNVHVLGSRPYAKTPAYVQAMDVNTMCYRWNASGWWTSGYPLKMHEALAVGKPVIGSPIQHVAAFRHVIDLAATVEEWTAAIERAIVSGGVSTPAERLAVARQNTWTSRVDQLDAWLREMAGINP
jgi:glycosyltransferase involved in cell wall biosynthesis